MSRKKLILSLLLGLAISVAAIAVSFRGVPFREMAGYLGGADYAWCLPALLLSLGSFCTRVVRWRIILAPVARLSFWECWHPMMIGFGMNCILPGRVGEFARPGILKKKYGISFFSVLATVAAERVFDLIILLSLFVGVMFFAPINEAASAHVFGVTLSRHTLDSAVTGMVRAGAVLLVGMAAVIIPATRKLMELVAMKSPDLLFFAPPEFRERIRNSVCVPVVGTMERISQGFSLVRDPVKLVVVILLSLLTWVLLAGLHWVLAHGFPGLSLTFFQWTAVMVIVCFFISLPSAPGFWGLWEAGGVFALALFGVPLKVAAGFTLVNHVLQISPAIIMGLVSGVVTGVSMFRLPEEEGPEPGDPAEAPEAGA
ncbi:MAG: lysylphosphatidylglycerol synthase transmembrane domain-containing protein [Thermodesulfobacteriota bacterium]